MQEAHRGSHLIRWNAQPHLGRRLRLSVILQQRESMTVSWLVCGLTGMDGTMMMAIGVQTPQVQPMADS